MYRPGRNEQNPADNISQHPQTTPTKENAGEEYIAFLAKCGVPKAMTQDEVRFETPRDPQFQKVMQAVQSGQWRGDISDFTRFKDEISVHDGLVLRGHTSPITSEPSYRNCSPVTTRDSKDQTTNQGKNLVP